MTQFNKLIASPTGVQQIFNEKGGSNIVIARIEGVRASDRAPVRGDFTVIQPHNQGFLVTGQDRGIYKAGQADIDCNIIAERITADVGKSAVVAVEPVILNDEQLVKISQFNRAGALVFVSGQMQIDDPEDITIVQNPHQFPTIKLNGASVSLESAPLAQVLAYFSDQFATGQLSIRSIYAQTTTTSNSQARS